MSKTRKIILTICIVVAVICVAYLAWFFIRKAVSARKDERLSSIASVQTSEAETEKPTTAQTRETSTTEEEETTEPYVSPVDFEALWEINPELYAWLVMPNTHIDYPVAQHYDPNFRDYYLRTGYDHNYDFSGTLFSIDNATDLSDDVIIIYGHNQSRFEELRSFRNENYWEDHREMTLYGPDAEYTFTIFAAVVVSDVYIPGAFNLYKSTGREMFLDLVNASNDLNSHIDTSIEVTGDDKLLVLSTCVPERSEQRYLVIGVCKDNTD